MTTLIADHWRDYELIDCGDGEKLERWKDAILRRPDPQAVWPKDSSISEWKNCDAVYHRSAKGGGSWEFKRPLPEEWNIHYGSLVFKVSPTGFKHTGLFPEQAVNWEWMSRLISEHADESIRILNLFAYTGGATMADSMAGAAEVVHVDASKGMVLWAKENMQLCRLQDHKIRFLVDDCLKFCEREKRRGHTYEGILMDPPSYGRGPNGEMWKFEKEISGLIQAAASLLSDHPLFFLINSYTTGMSSIVLENLLQTEVAPGLPQGKISAGDIAIPMSRRKLLLPCGVYGRWERNGQGTV